MAGTGGFSSVTEACRAAVKEVSSVEPRARESQIYRRGYELYKSLYPSLRPIYGLIDGLR